MLAPMSRRLPTRIAGLVFALAACAWFAISIRQTHDLNAATSLISGSSSITPGPARRAATLLHDAGQLNPDVTVDLERSQLALHQGDHARARAIALAVTRSEPRNIEAWLAYGSASSDDRRAFTSALRHLRELAPPVSGS
jgi:hypothetical protein